MTELFDKATTPLQAFRNEYFCRLAFIVRILCFLLLTSSAAIADSVHYGHDSAGKIENPKILILGDSISAAYGMPQEKSWPALLNAKLSTTFPKAKIINASISGETTSGGRIRLPKLLQRYAPNIMILELGGNDGLRGFPIKVIRENLDEMITQAKQHGSQVLLLGMRIPPNYGAQYTEQFFDSYQSLAKQHDIPVVPFLLENIALNKSLMQTDGIHPNADAQPAILGNVLSELMPLIRDIVSFRESPI